MNINNEYKKLVFLVLALLTPLVSPTIALPVVIICMSIVYGLKMFLDQKERLANESMKLEIESLKKQVTDDVESIRNSVNGLVIKNSVKPVDKEIKRFF